MIADSFKTNLISFSSLQSTEFLCDFSVDVNNTLPRIKMLYSEHVLMFGIVSEIASIFGKVFCSNSCHV